LGVRKAEGRPIKKVLKELKAEKDPVEEKGAKSNLPREGERKGAASVNLSPAKKENSAR